MRETIPEDLKDRYDFVCRVEPLSPSTDTTQESIRIVAEKEIGNPHFERKLIERIAKAEARNKVLEGLLQELAALVRGESPRLLDEDRGGDADLSWKIDAVLREDR